MLNVFYCSLFSNIHFEKVGYLVCKLILYNYYFLKFISLWLSARCMHPTSASARYDSHRVAHPSEKISGTHTYSNGNIHAKSSAAISPHQQQIPIPFFPLSSLPLHSFTLLSSYSTVKAKEIKGNPHFSPAPLRSQPQSNPKRVSKDGQIGGGCHHRRGDGRVRTRPDRKTQHCASLLRLLPPLRS
jgi:hypothetical protein